MSQNHQSCRQHKDKPRASDERGAALLMVLLIVAVMSVTAITVTQDLRFALRRTQTVTDSEQATWYALGAEELVSQLIAEANMQDPSMMILNSDEVRNGLVFPISGGVITATVQDQQNCFNINSLVDPGEDSAGINTGAAKSLQLLLTDIGLGANEARALTNAIADWVDENGSPLSGGAEDFDYALFDPPYRAANTLMVDLSELRAVAGMTETSYKAARPFLCARADQERSILNMNTLREDQAVLLHATLEGLISVQDARAIVASRPEEGFEDVAEVWEAPELVEQQTEGMTDRLDIRSSLFEVSATVVYKNAYVELRSTLEANGSGAARVISRRFGALS